MSIVCCKFCRSFLLPNQQYNLIYTLLTQMLEKPPKTPPYYRKVPNTNYIVDCFGIESLGYIFFLTHFHADHYGGLNKKFSSIIYCSRTTANLAKKLAKKECLYSLDLYQWYRIEKNNYVLLLDANHCPGAVCFVFCINSLFYFHTGDFRCENEFFKQFEHAKISADIIELPLHPNNNQDTNCNSVKEETHHKLPVTNIMQIGYDRLYIDNTYEGYRPFDTQEQIIHNVLSIIEKKIHDKNVLVPINYCFMFATYSVGKEKIFLSVAEYFDFDIFVSKYKMDLISCIETADRTKIDGQVKDILRSYKSKKCENTKPRNLVESQFTGIKRLKLKDDDRSCIQESENIGFENVFDRFTMTSTNNSIHIISMMHLNKVKLESIVKRLKYDKIVIIAGIGWKDMTRYYDWEREDGRKIKKGIEVIYVPYSEHSSDNELKEFKTKLKCKKTVNTVKNKY